MVRVQGKCSGCGARVELEVAPPFAGAAVPAALCSACADQECLDRGGVVVTLRRQPEGAKFALGKITITAGAVDALAAASQHAAEFLVPHARGDWGAFGHCEEIQLSAEERRRGWEATEDSGKVNKSNLLSGRDRIMSEYATARGRRLWIITTLYGGGETVVLLPEEY